MQITLKRVVEICVFAYAFFLASRPLSDGDFWWHLKTGEYIFTHHAIPRTDIFSFTNFGKPWVAHEWLSDLIFYIGYSHLGFNFLIFIFAILAAIAFWLVFRRSPAHPFVTAFATLLAAASILPTIGVRPRVFTLLFASVYLSVLVSFAQRETSKRIWWLVPVMVLWVNLHAGYLIGLVLIALTIVGLILDQWWLERGKADIWPKVRKLVLVFTACCLAVLINPQGYRILLFPFEFFFSPIQQNHVIDWLSPDFHQPEFLPLALLILFTAGALALSPKRPKPSELLLFLSVLYATLKSNRHVAIFALVSAPILSNYLQALIDSTSLQKSFGLQRSTVTGRGPLILGFVMLLPLFLLLVQLRKEIYSPPRQDRVGVPLKAVEFLKQKGITGRTFTDPNIWSGLVIWSLPSNPVFIDGRIDMYRDQFVANFIKITNGLEDWRKLFDDYGIQVVILNQNSALKLQLQSSAAWQQLYSDEMAVVFVRR